MSFKPSGGTSGSISGSSDTALSNPADGEVLVYNSGVQKWRNAPAPSGGTLADSSVTSAKIADRTIVAADISLTAAITASQLDTPTQTTLTSVANKLDSSTASSTYAPKASPTFTGTVTLPTAAPTVASQAAPKSYVDAQVAAVTSSGAPDAAAGTKGIISLNGDLAGTGSAATAPVISAAAITTAKLADSSVTSAKIADGTIVAADLSASAAIATSQLDASTQTTLGSVANKLDTSAASATYAPKASPTFTGTITLPSAAPTANTQAVTKGYVDTQISAVASNGTPDATANANGLIRLAGDLGGGADPAAPKLASTINVNAIISANTTVTGNTSAIAGKAAKGANSDITSLTGLTTALSVAQGGTGATSASAALTALGGLATTQRGAASGVASLDTNTLVPRAQLGTGTASSSTVLYGDGVWRTASGGSTSYTWTGVKTANYTVSSGDAVICDASAGGFTVTLPTNLGANAFVRVKKTDSTVNAVLVASSATIDGSASFSLNNQYASQDFSYTGSIWYAV